MYTVLASPVYVLYTIHHTHVVFNVYYVRLYILKTSLPMIMTIAPCMDPANPILYMYVHQTVFSVYYVQPDILKTSLLMI